MVVYFIQMDVLDLCCGRGGWSKGFAQEGFTPIGVDIVDVGYPYRLILSDLRLFDSEPFKGIDVIVGSPPCRDFSIMSNFGVKSWKDPPNPERGMELVREFLRIVDEIMPRYWLMENVVGLTKYIELPPVMIGKIARGRSRSFWGDFPLWLIQRDMVAPLVRKVIGNNLGKGRCH